jgi:chromosomal replication initiation ATPase DnaA
MREAVEEPYEEVPSWGGTVKGDEAFADRVLQAVGEPAVVPRGMTVERFAREVARVEGVELYRMQSPSRDRETSRARFMVAWLAREVGRIAVARTAKFFGRAGGTMIIGLNRFEDTIKSDRHLRRTLATIRDNLLHARKNNSTS